MSRVLVVDDDVAITRLIVLVLERDRHLLTVVHDGRSALDTLATAPRFDACVLDLMLPDMSGVDVLRRIRATSAIADLPVVVLTGRGVARRDWAPTANYQLAKPFSASTLRMVVRRAVTTPRSRKRQ